MIHSYEDLRPERVAGIGFDDPATATRRLRDLAGYDISDERFARLLPMLAAALQTTGDPDRALINFSAWLERVGNRSTYFSLLSAHPVALNALVTIFSISQFFSDLLARYPEQFEIVINPLIRDMVRGPDESYRDAALRMRVAKSIGAKRDALRRFKPAEILRIGARDLLGIADPEQIASEISGFAEACVRAAVHIAGAPPGFAVIALGKLGGGELNYASDIDLMYIHADEMPGTRAAELAESVTQSLERPTDAGFLFRVDLRLRPEGRFGAISRSISSCRAYYESWAEDWERQAMLKARYVGGDVAVAERFLAIVEPFVYRRTVDRAFIASLQAGKRRIERRTSQSGGLGGNVKEGRGAIRDVEFIVQAIQLARGGQLPEIRTGSTMEALRRLQTVGLLEADAAGDLAESYLFLRDVEHRLQIMDERPVRDLPLGDPHALNMFARRLRYADSEQFLREYRRHTERTGGYLDRLFYGENRPSVADQSTASDSLISDWVRDPGNGELRIAVATRMTEIGFADAAAAMRAIEREVAATDYGEALPQLRALLARIAEPLIDACGLSGYPDDALKGVLALSSSAPSPAAVLSSLVESPALLVRLTRLAGAATALWPTLCRYPELLDRLADDDLLARASPLEPSSPSLAAEPQRTAAHIRREQLRIAATDVWGLASPDDVMAALTITAEQALAAALDAAVREEGFAGMSDADAPIPALIGLGKLGGAELAYASDWDLLWIAPDGADSAAVRRIAERTMTFLSTGVKAHGVTVEVDARLRPEGRFGALARSLPDYVEYFEERADAWERQVLIKARPIAGDLDLGRSFMTAATALVYGRAPDPDAVGQIRHLKARIEHERAHSQTDLKLGPGGLSDIEWTVQLLQWRNGGRWPKARASGTLGALNALRDAAVIRQDDWDILASTYRALYTLRNHSWLRGARGDAPATGIADPTPLRRQVREIFERLFLETE